MKNNLLRDPWVGENYLLNNDRLLIVGESHYSQIDGEFSETLFQEFTNDRNSTKYIIEALTRGDKSWKVFDNLYRTLFKTKDINVADFWSSVSFYNFVQRPLKSLNDRPTKNDYLDGFETFAELVRGNQFDTAIFIGNSSAKYFNTLMTDHLVDYSHQCTFWDKINKCYAHQFFITNGKENFKIHFMQHTSHRSFSWKEWNKYFEIEAPDLLQNIQHYPAVSSS